MINWVRQKKSTFLTTDEASAVSLCGQSPFFSNNRHLLLVNEVKFIIFMFLLASINFAAARAYAEPVRRSLELELDEIVGMKGYEIRVTRLLDGQAKKKPVFFKIHGHTWSAKLLPGRYNIELRSFDSRDVPGEWSAPQEVVVKLPAAELIEPADQGQVNSENADQERITLSWKPVEGAEQYKVTVLKADGSVAQDLVVRDPSVKIKLAVAQTYSWTVTPLMEAKLDGDVSAIHHFTLVGGALDRSKILPVDDINTVEITWAGVQHAMEYDFVLEKLTDKGDWQAYDHRLVKNVKRNFSKPLVSGRYRVKVIAQGEARKPSEPASFEFKTLFVNSRSPAAIEQVKTETSYDPKTVIFGLASYTLTMVQYAGSNNDITNKFYPVNFTAVGATGHLGVGTWFKEDSKYGLLASADLSGIEVAGQTQTYFSGSVQGVYRERLGAVGQLRVSFGAQSRDLPVTLANSNLTNGTGTPGQGSNTYQDKISNLGPVAGFALLHGFTRKVGLQINGQVFDSSIGTHTPNGQSSVATLSYQAGLLGSLNLAPKLVGFAGYTYRSENATYGSFSTYNDTVSLTGHYINLTLEYGF